MTGTRAAFGVALLLEFSSEMSGHLSQRWPQKRKLAERSARFS